MTAAIGCVDGHLWTFPASFLLKARSGDLVQTKVERLVLVIGVLVSHLSFYAAMQKEEYHQCDSDRDAN